MVWVIVFKIHSKNIQNHDLISGLNMCLMLFSGTQDMITKIFPNTTNNLSWQGNLSNNHTLSKHYFGNNVCVLTLIDWKTSNTEFLDISIDDYVGIWRRVDSGTYHACHKINDTRIECKSGKMRPQILTINQNKITWELNGENGVSTFLYGAYIGKDILMIAKHLWEKQGTKQFWY